DSSAAFEPEVRNNVRREVCANFGFAALAEKQIVPILSRGTFGWKTGTFAAARRSTLLVRVVRGGWYGTPHFHLSKNRQAGRYRGCHRDHDAVAHPLANDPCAMSCLRRDP